MTFHFEFLGNNTCRERTSSLLLEQAEEPVGINLFYSLYVICIWLCHVWNANFYSYAALSFEFDFLFSKNLYPGLWCEIPDQCVPNPRLISFCTWQNSYYVLKTSIRRFRKWWTSMQTKDSMKTLPWQKGYTSVHICNLKEVEPNKDQTEQRGLNWDRWQLKPDSLTKT